MAGLLDAFNSPEMGMAMGLLQAGGPSARPVSLGQAIGQGYGGFQGAQESQQARKMRDQQMQMHSMQMKQIQDAQKADQEAKAGLQSYLGQLQQTEPQKAGQIIQALKMGVSPAKVWEKLNPERQDYTLGNTRFSGADNRQLATVPKERSLPEGMQLGLDGQTLQEIPGYVAMKSKIAAAGRAPQTQTPYFTSVSDATKGMGTFDARTGKYAFPESPLVKPQNDPKLQGQISGAKVAGEASAKRDVNMSGISDVISRAESILSGKTGNKPTSSGLGVGLDAAAGFIGVSPKGAAEASELKALGGALVAKMPRMEGPQSNLDVQLYREMAGDIANPMLPLERRIKALETVRSLYTKYDKSAGSGVDALLDKYKD